MRDWNDLFGCILNDVFGFLRPDGFEGNEISGDRNVRCVCRKWRGCKAFCPVLKFINQCNDDDVSRIMGGVNVRSVRKICFENLSGNVNAEPLNMLMRVGLLEELELDCFEDGKWSMNDLVECRNLRSFRVRNCTGMEWCDLRKLRKLEELVLRYCGGVTDGFLRVLGGGLSVLDISGCDMINSGIDEVSGGLGIRMKKLRVLKMSGCGKVDNNYVEIVCGGCRELEELNVSGCDVWGDSLIGAVSNLKKLRKLDLSRCKRIGDAEVVRLGRMGLSELFIGGTKVTDGGLIGGGFERLEVLNLSSCDGIDGSGLSDGRFCNLRVLDLSYCKNLAVENISVLVGENWYIFGQYNLRELTMKSCFTNFWRNRSVTCQFGNSLESLELFNVSVNAALISKMMCRKLILGFCNLNDDSLGFLRGMDLEMLHLFDNKNITNEGLEAVSGMRSLKSFKVLRCVAINDVGLNSLVNLVNLAELRMSVCKKDGFTKEYVSGRLKGLINLCLLYVYDDM